MAAFQFLNPKSWLVVVTAVAAQPVITPMTILELAVLFVVIFAACLFVWMAGGALLTRALARADINAGFERIMGVLLAANALLLLQGPNA